MFPVGLYFSHPKRSLFWQRPILAFNRKQHLKPMKPDHAQYATLFSKKPCSTCFNVPMDEHMAYTSHDHFLWSGPLPQTGNNMRLLLENHPPAATASRLVFHVHFYFWAAGTGAAPGRSCLRVSFGVRGENPLEWTGHKCLVQPKGEKKFTGSWANNVCLYWGEGAPRGQVSYSETLSLRWQGPIQSPCTTSPTKLTFKSERIGKPPT